ncbi:unnamed protein product [Effrenium voratum]|uniref:NADAR domain-containing protein n=1 Tax=Effrenium voratum TaxID=2562239 RepID=A0AA36JA75_9DINO|nr:unnamed protein product [Effrenium voratum]
MTPAPGKLADWWTLASLNPRAVPVQHKLEDDTSCHCRSSSPLTKDDRWRMQGLLPSTSLATPLQQMYAARPHFWRTSSRGEPADQLVEWDVRKLSECRGGLSVPEKFWDRRQEFRYLSGHDAFRKKQQLKGREDNYAGHGSNWAAMRHVLFQKFEDGELRKGLMATGDAVLLEHNPVPNRDTIWSNNNDGSGKNWLGLQLMILRAELRREDRWLPWLMQHVDFNTGACSNSEESAPGGFRKRETE